MNACQKLTNGNGKTLLEFTNSFTESDVEVMKFVDNNDAIAQHESVSAFGRIYYIRPPIAVGFHSEQRENEEDERLKEIRLKCCVKQTVEARRTGDLPSASFPY